MANTTMTMMIQSQIDTVILSLGRADFTASRPVFATCAAYAASYQSKRQSLSLDRPI
jgi:hypothetical protein